MIPARALSILTARIFGPVPSRSGPQDTTFLFDRFIDMLNRHDCSTAGEMEENGMPLNKNIKK